VLAIAKISAHGLYAKLVMHTVIFARTSPSQKVPLQISDGSQLQEEILRLFKHHDSTTAPSARAARMEELRGFTRFLGMASTLAGGTRGAPSEETAKVKMRSDFGQL
jgi:hypothetical protein